MISAIQNYNLQTRKNNVNFGSRNKEAIETNDYRTLHSGVVSKSAAVALAALCLAACNKNTYNNVSDAFSNYDNIAINDCIKKLYPVDKPELKLENNENLQLVNNLKEIIKEVKIEDFAGTDFGFKCRLKSKEIDVSVVHNEDEGETRIRGEINGAKGDYTIKQEMANGSVSIIDNKNNKVIETGNNCLKTVPIGLGTLAGGGLAIIGLCILVLLYALSKYDGDYRCNEFA